eukprot:119772_1
MDIKPSTTTISHFDSNQTYDSAPSVTSMSRMKSFEYITDTESSFDGYDMLQFDRQQMPILNRNKNNQTNEILKIQASLKKWIGTQQHLILSQFIDLMTFIQPHVTAKDATEIFDRIDKFHNGQISCKFLLQNEFLTRIILKLFHDNEYESSVDVEVDESESKCDDSKYLHMNPRQLLEETKRMQQWIINYGQPALEKVNELQEIITVYKSDRHTQQLRLKKQESVYEELNDLEEELKQSTVRSSFLMVDNKHLVLQAQESNNRWATEHNLVKNKDGELKRYKKLSKEMSVINEKYLKRNQQLIEKNTILEQEVQELRQIVLSIENEALQVYQDNYAEMECLKNEIVILKSELEQKQTASGFHSTSGDSGDDLGTLFHQNRTIHIDKSTLEDNTMANIVKPSETKTSRFHSMHNRRATLSHWYKNSTHHAIQPLFMSQKMNISQSRRRSQSRSGVDENKMEKWGNVRGVVQQSDDQEDSCVFMVDRNDNDTDVLFRMGSSFNINFQNTDSNASAQTNSNSIISPQIYNQKTNDIFENAMTAEIKNELRNKIKEELIEDFE